MSDLHENRYREEMNRTNLRRIVFVFLKPKMVNFDLEVTLTRCGCFMCLKIGTQGK